MIVCASAYCGFVIGLLVHGLRGGFLTQRPNAPRSQQVGHTNTISTFGIHNPVRIGTGFGTSQDLGLCFFQFHSHLRPATMPAAAYPVSDITFLALEAASGMYEAFTNSAL
jgi:hypothetical protein